MDHLVFPDGVKALTELIKGKEFAGHTVDAGSFVPKEAYDAIPTTPFVLIATDGGNPGYVDQAEQLTLRVYAAGGVALPVAQAIKSAVVGDNIDTTVGFLDTIKCDRLPTVGSPTDTQDEAVLLLTVISRPIE